MRSSRFVRLGLGIAFATLFVWLIARRVERDSLAQAFTGARLGWIAAALLAFCAGYFCRIERWRSMLARDNPGLRRGACAGPLLAGFAANNVLPFRAGDVLRAFAFNARLGASSGTVLATLFVERLLDLLVVLVLLLAALAAFGLNAHRIAGLGAVSLIAIGCAILGLLFRPQLLAVVVRAAGEPLARLLPRRSQRLGAEIDRGLSTLRHLSGGHTMFRLLAWSIMTWLAEGCVFWFAALAVSGLTAPEAGWLALPLGTLATLIPSTPGYVGTFDYFTIRGMTALGNAMAPAVAHALLVHALLWLPPTLAGGLYLLLRRASAGDPHQTPS
jgi:uncharacterized protein (TIRG00374 family)